MHNRITFELLQGRPGLATLEQGWKRLQALGDSTKFYQAWEWYACIAESLLPEQLFFVVAAAGGELAGIFPLQMIRAAHYGIAFSSLRFPKHPHVNECDFLVHPSMYGVGLFSQLVDFLHEQSGIRWDVLQLERSPLGSCCDRLVTEEKIPLGRSTAAGSSSEIDCGSPEKSSLAHLSGHFRRNLARLERRAARHGELSHVSYFDAASMDEGLRLFIDIENDGWKGTAGSSIASDENLRRFYSSLATRFTGESRCCINVLQIVGKPAAANFGIVSSGIYYILKIGFRQRYAELAPGNLLLASTIRHLSEDPDVHTVDLVTSPKWAEKWKTHCKSLCTHAVFHRSLKGHLLCMMIRSKDWLLSLRQGRGRA